MKKQTSLLIILFGHIVAHAQILSRDMSFAGGGLLLANLAEEQGKVNIQNDDKLLYVNTENTPEVLQDVIRLARFTKDGYPDTTFGNQGAIEHYFHNVMNDVHSISVLHMSAPAFQDDGKILLAGRASFGEMSTGLHHRMCVWRFNHNGTLDENFGNGGFYISGEEIDFNSSYYVKASNDEKIFVAGTAYGTSHYANASYDLTVWCLKNNGVLDLSFNGEGFKGVNCANDNNVNGHEHPTGLAIKPNGEIIVGYWLQQCGNLATSGYFGYYALSSDGNSVTDFSLGSLGNEGIHYVKNIMALPDNGVLITEAHYSGIHAYSRLFKIDASHVMNTIITNEGFWLESITKIILEDVTVLNNGKIIVLATGNYFNGGDEYYPFISQLNDDYTFDYNFGNGGIFQYTYTGLNKVFDQSDGKIILANGGSAIRFKYGGTGTGVGDLLENTLHIYPNPAKDNLTVYGVKVGADIRVVDILGKELYFVKATSDNQTIPVAHLASGLYLVNNRKFVKE